MSTTESGVKLPFQDALLEVVKSLHKDPVLVYGIGAGIILVAALAFTTSLALVLVVAAVLVVVVLGRILGRTQAKRGGGVFAKAFLFGSSYDNLRAANVESRAMPKGEVRTRGGLIFTRGKKAEVGNVTLGGADEPKDG